MRAASGRATGARSDAVLRTAMPAPGTIARMVRRAVICLEIPSSSAVPGWRKGVNSALTLGFSALYLPDRMAGLQVRPGG